MKKICVIAFVVFTGFRTNVIVNKVSARAVPADDTTLQIKELYDSTIKNQLPVVKTQFGTLVFGNKLNTDEKINAAKLYMPPKSIIRDRIFLNKGGESPTYQKWVDAGFDIGMIIKVGNSDEPAPFLKDFTDYSAKLTEAVKKYKPKFWNVRDEETNRKMNVGSMADYINEMNVASKIIHAVGGKVTNGGIHTPGVSLLLYYNYISKGMNAEAESFKDRVFSPEMKDFTENPAKNNKLYRIMKACDTLIHAYKSAGMDYLNMHWKEPLNHKGDAQHIDRAAYKEIINFLKAESGLPIMSNEVEVIAETGSTQIVKEMLEELTANGLVYIFLFNSTKYKVGFTGDDGRISPYGVMARDFIAGYNAR